MYVEEARGLCFLASPKTASRATKQYLLQRGFIRSHDSRIARHWGASGAGNNTSHHRRLPAHPGEDWTVFTTIRNHWDAWASWWFYARRPEETEFNPRFIDRILQQNNGRIMFPEPGRMWGLHDGVCDRILRYESLEDDLADVLGHQVVLPRFGVSKGRDGLDYRELHTPETQEYVYELFGPEIERYGYTY